MQLKHVAQQLYRGPPRVLGYSPKIITFGREGVTLEDALCGDKIPSGWQVEAADYFDGAQKIILRFHVRIQILLRSGRPDISDRGGL